VKRQRKILRKDGEPAARSLIRKPEVRRRTGYSDTTIWRLERDGLFPRRVQIGEMAVGWYEDEISEWIQSRVRQGGKRPTVQYRGGPTNPKLDERGTEVTPQLEN